MLLSGLGKSTLINSLFLTNLYEDREVPEAAVKAGQTVSIEASTVEIEERGVKELIQIFILSKRLGLVTVGSQDGNGVGFKKLNR